MSNGLTLGLAETRYSKYSELRRSGFRPVASNVSTLAVSTNTATKVSAFPAGTNTDRRGTSIRTFHRLTADIRALKLVWANFYGQNGSSSEIANPNPVWIKAAIEPPTTARSNTRISGVMSPVYFGGQHRVTKILPGRITISDEVPYSASKGDIVYVDQFWHAPGPDWYLPQYGKLCGAASTSTTTPNFALGEGYVYGDSVDSGNMTNYTVPAAPGPVVILGYSDNPQPCIIDHGDSIAGGVNDTSSTKGVGTGSWLTRICEGQTGLVYNYDLTPVIGYIKITCPGETCQHFQATRAMREALMDLATTFITNSSINDMGTSGDVSAWEAAYIALLVDRARQGQRIIMLTQFPVSTSTDNFRTTTNQTPDATKSDRILANRKIRDLTGSTGIKQQVLAIVPDADIVLADVAALIEVDSSGTPDPEGGCWPAAANGAAWDETLTQTSNSSTSITDSSKAWTTHQWQGYIVVALTGALAGTTNNLQNNSGSTISMSGNALSTAANGDTFGIFRPWTVDGTHPTSWASYQIADLARELILSLVI